MSLLRVIRQIRRAVIAMVSLLDPREGSPRPRRTGERRSRRPRLAADYDGSAKVALLGIERSHAAWLELVHRGLASPIDIEPLIADLIWLCDELERVFPHARAFVRPGLDQPDEVARLLAEESGQR